MPTIHHLVVSAIQSNQVQAMLTHLVWMDTKRLDCGTVRTILGTLVTEEGSMAGKGAKLYDKFTAIVLEKGLHNKKA